MQMKINFKTKDSRRCTKQPNVIAETDLRPAGTAGSGGPRPAYRDRIVRRQELDWVRRSEASFVTAADAGPDPLPTPSARDANRHGAGAPGSHELVRRWGR